MLAIDRNTTVIDMSIIHSVNNRPFTDTASHSEAGKLEMQALYAYIGSKWSYWILAAVYIHILTK